MRLAIVGSRDFEDYKLLKRQILLNLNISEVKLIVSGGARGVDSLGEKLADEYNIPKLIHRPDWKLYGRAAGMIRNEFIVRDADTVFAIWDGVSRGTNNAIGWANKLKKELILVKFTKSFDKDEKAVYIFI